MTIREDIGYYGVLLAVITRDGAECLRNYLCDQILKISAKKEVGPTTSQRLLNDYIDPTVILSREVCLWNDEEQDLLSHGKGLPLEDMSFALTAKIIRHFLPADDGKVNPEWWMCRQAGDTQQNNIQRVMQLHIELYDADSTRMTKEKFDSTWSELITNLERLQQSFDKEQYSDLCRQCQTVTTAEDYFELLHELSSKRMDCFVRLQTDYQRNESHSYERKKQNFSDSDSDSSADEERNDFDQDVCDVPDGAATDDTVDTGPWEMEMKVLNVLHFYPEDANNPDLPNLGHLSALNLLGSGGFGKVWLYEDISTGDLVAVKQGSSNCKTAIKVLTNEIQILRSLKHDRIVRYYGARVIHARFSLLMEYVPKGSLRDKIKDEGYLNEISTIHYTKQILEGIAYLHSNLVIHRDVKAANVMLTENNDIKLGDFGLAWQLPRERDKASGRAGTIYYLAPEVARGEPYGMKADIWSLGCSVLEMILGDPPFANAKKDTEEIIWMVANAVPIFVLPANVSATLRSLINQIFILKPDKRPTAKQLLKHDAFNSS